jgi:hypothetical protein
MSLTHCPLCIGLALLSVIRAIAHLGLLLATGPRQLTAAIAQAAI